jgi:hypothetical protein
MAKTKFDGVVEAVHYTPLRQVEWVRAYLRRGMVFTDRLLVDRQSLVEHLKSGKKLMAGKRLPLMGGTFEVTHPLRLIEQDGRDVLVVGDEQAEHDYLEGVPVI